jgi:hypothetical protein
VLITVAQEGGKLSDVALFRFQGPKSVVYTDADTNKTVYSLWLGGGVCKDPRLYAYTLSNTPVAPHPQCGRTPRAQCALIHDRETMILLLHRRYCGQSRRAIQETGRLHIPGGQPRAPLARRRILHRLRWRGLHNAAVGRRCKVDSVWQNYGGVRHRVILLWRCPQTVDVIPHVVIHIVVW